MKKSSITLLSAGLVFVMMLSSFSLPNIKQTNTQISPNDIRYQVSVTLNPDLPLCNHYLVLVYDEHRNAVAPAQPLMPGKSIYYFYEKGPVSGVRYASIQVAGYTYICSQQLLTTPSYLYGLFLRGRTYLFELNPQVIYPNANQH